MSIVNTSCRRFNLNIFIEGKKKLKTMLYTGYPAGLITPAHTKVKVNLLSQISACFIVGMKSPEILKSENITEFRTLIAICLLTLPSLIFPDFGALWDFPTFTRGGRQTWLVFHFSIHVFDGRCHWAIHLPLLI